MQHQKHIFGEEDMSVIVHMPFLWLVLYHRAWPLKAVFPLPTGFWLGFVKRNHLRVTGGLKEGRTKDTVTLSPFSAASLVVVISPLWSYLGPCSLTPGFGYTISSLKLCHPIMTVSPFANLRIAPLILICKLFQHCYKFHTLASF